MFHILYKTTNTVNGKFYVGVHSTTEIGDGYLGSGTVIKKAIKKYGKKNFTKEVLLICESSEEAYDLERLLVCDKLINRKDVYNSSIGGKGAHKGYSYVYNAEGAMFYLPSEDVASNPELSYRKHTESSKLKMSNIRTEFLKTLSDEEYTAKFCGRKLTEEHIDKIRSAQIGVKRGGLTDDHKNKVSESLSIFWANLPVSERLTLCRTKTEETEKQRRLNISNSSRKPKEKTQCPHCGKLGGVGALKRYHFDNCKHLKDKYAETNQ